MRAEEYLEATTIYPVFRTRPRLLESRHRRILVDMACTSTVAQFTDRILGFRALGFLMWARFVIACMTARTVGLVRRVGPVNDLGITLVTPGATQISPVIEGFVS